MTRHTKRIGTLLFAAMLTACTYFNQSSPASQRLTQESQSLYEVLDLYDFDDSTKKEALLSLFSKAGEDVNDLFYSKVSSASELQRKILTLIKVTQDKFVLRKGAEERWQIKAAAWMQDKPQEIIPALTTLDIVGEILPSEKEVDVLCILGATKTRMRERLDFATSLYQKQLISAKHMVLLVGERYVVDSGQDGTKQELAALAARLHKRVNALTETDLMRDLYSKSFFNSRLEATVIDTPKGDLA